MDHLRSQARELARYLPYLSAMLNHASLVIREEQVASNRRLGGRGDDYAVHAAALAWNIGNRAHTLVHEAPYARSLPVEVVSGRDTLHVLLGGIRVIMSKQRPVLEEEPGQPPLPGIVPLTPVRPEWVLIVNPRRVNHVEVPPLERTLANGGWPAPDVLARPAIGEHEFLAMIDYIHRAYLLDRVSSVRLPVFARDVVLGKQGRMIDCWSALGEEVDAAGQAR